jgi:hypothetical protein
MNNISFLLQKYLSLGLKEDNIKNTIIKSINDVCGITVDKSNVKVGGESINIDVYGVEKAEIFINKQKIEDQIKIEIEKLGYKFSDREMR